MTAIGVKVEMAKQALKANYEDISMMLQLNLCISWCCAAGNGKIQGVVTTVSPMKKSKTCKYFDGELTNGKGTT